MTVHLRTPGELIAAVPGLLGFIPSDSLVVVGVSSAGRVAPLIRIDRGDCLVPELADQVSSTVAGHLARARATSVVLVSFRNKDSRLNCGALDAMRTRLERHVEVTDWWVTANGRFRTPECPDPRCCPDGGRPVPQAADSVARDEHRRYSSHVPHVPMRDSAPAGRRKAANAAFGRAWRAREKAEREAKEGAAAHGLDPRWTDPSERWRVRQLEAWRDALERARDGELPTDAQTGRLAAGLSDVVVRDAAVIDMIPGRGDVADALCGDPGALGVREALSAMITKENAVRADPATVAAIWVIADHVMWLCDAHAAPVLTLAGLAQWWSGDDASAEDSIANALIKQPGYRLAELVACALDAHLPPGWLAAA